MLVIVRAGVGVKRGVMVDGLFVLMHFILLRAVLHVRAKTLSVKKSYMVPSIAGNLIVTLFSFMSNTTNLPLYVCAPDAIIMLKLYRKRNHHIGIHLCGIIRQFDAGIFLSYIILSSNILFSVIS